VGARISLGGMIYACYDGENLKVKPMAVRCLEPAPPLLLVLIAWFVLAQVCSSQAACLAPGARLAPDEIAKLQANPKAIFLNSEGGPAGNAEIISKVRELVTTDKAALAPILEALKFAGTEEKSAIGTALGQAAQACITPDAGYAAEIQEALATTTDQVAILAFAAVTGNVPIGATGGGAGAGGGGGAGGGTAGTGTSSGGGTAAGGAGGGTTTPFFAATFSGLTLGANNAVANAAVSVSP
jgi:hypothetical protein